MRAFGFGDRTFDGYMIDLSIVLSLLPFIVKVGVGTSGDGKNFSVDGEVVGLLWWLVDL
jgi:hypothetical protein